MCVRTKRSNVFVCLLFVRRGSFQFFSAIFRFDRCQIHTHTRARLPAHTKSSEESPQNFKLIEAKLLADARHTKRIECENKSRRAILFTQSAHHSWKHTLWVYACVYFTKHMFNFRAIVVVVVVSIHCRIFRFCSTMWVCVCVVCKCARCLMWCVRFNLLLSKF